MSIQIEEGKFYKRADGSVHGPAQPNNDPCSNVFPWRVGETTYGNNGKFFKTYDRSSKDLVAEAADPSAPVTDIHAIETVEGPQIADTPEWAKGVEAEASVEYAVGDRDETTREMVWRLMVEAGITNPAQYIRDADEVPSTDIKTTIADEAKRIVSGARRSAYGKPEANFERIARFWDAYFKNTGRDISITAADVSPLMRLVKEARICESPGHYDSFVDLVGYTLTGAEVNGVKKPA